MAFKIEFDLDLPRHYVPMKKEEATNVSLFSDILSGNLRILVGKDDLFVEPVHNVNLLVFFKELIRVLEDEKDEDEIIYSTDEKPLKIKFENKTVCFSGKAVSKKLGCINEDIFIAGIVSSVKDFVHKIINWNPSFKKNPAFAKLVDFTVKIDKAQKAAK